MSVFHLLKEYLVISLHTHKAIIMSITTFATISQEIIILEMEIQAF